ASSNPSLSDPGERRCQKILRMRKFTILAQPETQTPLARRRGKRPAGRAAPVTLFHLFYQAEIRHRQSRQRQSRTRSGWQCPHRNGAIVVILWLSALLSGSVSARGSSDEWEPQVPLLTKFEH